METIIVAAFDLSYIDYLQRLEVEIVNNSEGRPVIHQYDAEDFLKPSDYELQEWVPYTIDELEIGAPRPKKPRT